MGAIGGAYRGKLGFQVASLPVKAKCGTWQRCRPIRHLICKPQKVDMPLLPSLRPTFLAFLFAFFTFTPLMMADETSDEPAEEDSPLLTIERIYQDHEFDAEGYAAEWSDDSQALERWQANEDRPKYDDLVRIDVETGEETILVPGYHLKPSAESTALSVQGHQWSADRSKLLIYTNSQRVWRQRTRGDYWVLDVTNWELRQIGKSFPDASLMFAKFSPDGQRVAYVSNRNIYAEDLLDGRIEQITETPSDDIINGTFDWVYEEELSLRDGFRWSPDGRKIAFWQLNTSGVAKFAMINNTDAFYPQVQTFAYPKTGQRNSACRIGVVELASKQTAWLPLPGDNRNHYVARMDWIPDDSQQILVQQLNRLQNTNRVFLCDVTTMKSGVSARTWFVETDDAWVDVHDESLWFDNHQQMTWVSERDGWRHVYAASRDSGQLRRITDSAFDVMELLAIDEATDSILFLASPDNATQTYLYRLSTNGGTAQRLTSTDQPGSHRYQISPDAKFAIHSYSSFAVPPNIELVRLADHSVVRTLEDNQALKDKLAKLDLGQTEFLHVPVADNVTLDGWCILPTAANTTSQNTALAEADEADSDLQKFPLLVHVYGEPAGQTVQDRWGGSGYLWHQMLSQQGVCVMSFDNRGTPAAKGRTWRKQVYRRVGILAPEDQATAVRHVLANRPYLDPDRVGVWGWSGGGSMTLNAMFKYPDLYHAGISIAPVPNQRHYDTIYQERYMGLPSDNSDGYRNGSPIHFANQLQGKLLIVHGTGDDNCHYQTVELLVNELVQHGKQFEMMAYPNRTHAIREGDGTTLHLRQMMTDFLKRSLRF